MFKILVVVLDLLINNFCINLFIIFSHRSKQMPEDSSTKYYQDNKERL